MKLQSYMRAHDKGPSAWIEHEFGHHSYQARGVGGRDTRTPSGSGTSIGQTSSPYREHATLYG